MHCPNLPILFFDPFVFIFCLVLFKLSLVLSCNSEVFHPEKSLDLNRVLVIQDKFSELNEVNYFGLTVSLAKHPNSTESGTAGWIFIGAPKSNFTLGTVECNAPGKVWRCRLGERHPHEDICHTLPLTSILCNETEANETRTCNTSFLGGSMIFANEFFLTCAPTWYKKRIFPNTNKTFNRMEGSCFWLTKNEAVEPRMKNYLIKGRFGKLEPFNGSMKSDPFNMGASPLELNNKSLNRWMYGGAGVSLHVTSSGEMLVGTPGIVGWKGGMYLYNPKKEKENEHILTIEYYKKIQEHEKEFDYFGYAITSGKFLNSTVLIAASSPKGSYGINKDRLVVGSVFLVTSSDFKLIQRGSAFNDTKEWKELAVIRGDQFGSYFGASLESVDLNGDSLDELLVGAPFYKTKMSNDGDVGCVFVYSLNKTNQKFGENPLQIEGKIDGGRFGSSIANLGDINQDGFEDVAIGAPFENNVGAVYVYYGSQWGINPSNFLRIGGERYRGNSVRFSGFGFSISGGVDIDRNGIPDFTVGSYKSKNSVIFRTRPRMVIHSNTSFYVNINNNKISTPALILPQESEEFEIRLCPSIWINTTLKRSMDTILLTHVSVDSRFTITSADNDKSVNNSAASSQSVLIHIRIPPETNSSCAVVKVNRIEAPVEHTNVMDKDEPDVIVKQRYSYVGIGDNTSLFSIYNIQQDNIDGQVAYVEIINSNFSDFCASCAYATINETKDVISFESDCKSWVSFNANIDDQDLLCKPGLRVVSVGVKGGTERNNINTPFHNNTLLKLGEIPWFLLNVEVENQNQTAHFPRILLKWKWINSKSSDTSTLTRKIKLPEFDSLQGCLATPNSLGEMEADCPLDRQRTRLKTNATKSLNFRFTTNPVIATHSKGLILEIETNIYLKNDMDFKNLTESFRINYQTHNVSVKLFNTSVPQIVTGMATDVFFILKGAFKGVTPVNAALRLLIPTKIVVNGKLREIFSIQLPKINFQGINCSFISDKTDPNSLHRSEEIAQIERDIEIMNARLKSGSSQSMDVVNCLDPKVQGRCLQFQCTFSHQRISPELFQVEFKARMDTETAGLLLKDKEESTILLAAYGEAQIFGGILSNNKNYHSETLAVVTVYLNKRKTVPLWIYIASAGGGFILLILIIFTLNRYGFFARHTKEKLEHLRLASMQIKFTEPEPIHTSRDQDHNTSWVFSRMSQSSISLSSIDLQN